MIVKPSQYEINNMYKDDLFYVQKRSLRYRFVRYVINKLLNIPSIFVVYKNNKYNQDDCMIFRKSDLLCQQIYSNVVCNYSRGLLKNVKPITLPKVTITLYGVNITFKDR